jgi:hypothetical protein
MICHLAGSVRHGYRDLAAKERCVDRFSSVVGTITSPIPENLDLDGTTLESNYYCEFSLQMLCSVSFLWAKWQSQHVSHRSAYLAAMLD